MKFFYIFCLSLIFVSCNEGFENSQSFSENEEGLLAFNTMDQRVNPQSPPSPVGPKIIKESYIRFQSENLDKTFDEINQLVRLNKGYIQNDNSSKSYGVHSRILNIRIPSKSFEAIIDSLDKHSYYYDDKRITLKDVTEEFIDVKARLKAKKALEERYINLLAKAKDVTEILQIERELSKIREEIEAKEGRLNYLNDRVNFSSLTIEFYKNISDNGVTISFGSKIINSLKSGFNSLALFFLGILSIWPFIIITLLLVFVFKRWFKKRKLKK